REQGERRDSGPSQGHDVLRLGVPDGAPVRRALQGTLPEVAESCRERWSRHERGMVRSGEVVVTSGTVATALQGPGGPAPSAEWHPASGGRRPGGSEDEGPESVADQEGAQSDDECPGDGPADVHLAGPSADDRGQNERDGDRGEDRPGLDGDGSE